MKILIVDDNADLANGLQEILSIDMHDTHVFNTAENALEACHKVKFDVAFIDVKLPGMNGVELFKQIRTISPETHLFIISGYRMTQIIEESTGIDNTAVIYENTIEEDVLKLVEKLDSTPLTLALADTDDYFDKLSRKLIEIGKKPLITSKYQLSNYNIDNYDLLILQMNQPLIYGLINFIELKQMGYHIPTVLISDTSIKDHPANKLHSLQLTGCLFKPFQLDEILDIVKQLQSNVESDNRKTDVKF